MATSSADFVKYLGKEGFCKVDETEKGWYITLVQRDPAEELAAERRAKRERAEAVRSHAAAPGAYRGGACRAVQDRGGHLLKQQGPWHGAAR